MKKRLRLTLVFLILVLSMTFSSALCTVTFEDGSYQKNTVITAAMSCDSNTEKNTAYTLNWTFENGTSVELDSGTTPSTVGENFYQTYDIPLTWPTGTFINATLQGVDLEGTASANVTAVGPVGSGGSIKITNAMFGGGYLGLISSVKGTVTDQNSKRISGGLCEIVILSNDETKVLLESYNPIMMGAVSLSEIFPPTKFNEGTDYSYEIECYCGSAGTSTECINEDGDSINKTATSTKNFFTTKKYLDVNTITDKSQYDLADFITICVNVTNIDYPERIPLEINYQARCSVGEDADSDTDRILIFSDGELYDQRGISANKTQMQCKQFTIPEIRRYEGTNSTCYASSVVWLIGEDGERLISYPTTSSFFTIYSKELNIKADWTQISESTFNSIINLSSDSYIDWNGSNTGNIDIRLISPEETLDPNIAKTIQAVDIDNILVANYISSITVTNLTGDAIPAYLEFTDQGNLEIELRDQNLDRSGWYNVTMVLNNYDERQSVALEGIENKTGTFHLDVACPSSASLGSDMTCEITAYVEESQTVEKEVDFTCFITDGTSNFSSQNFNQMVTRTPVTLSRDFTVPSTFTNQQQYVLQCYADYYNLGSRQDSFYDTFYAGSVPATSHSTPSSSSSASTITGDAINIDTEDKWWWPFGNDKDEEDKTT